MSDDTTTQVERQPFYGFGDQPFIPGICFPDGDDRVLSGGKWWRVDRVDSMVFERDA